MANLCNLSEFCRELKQVLHTYRYGIVTRSVTEKRDNLIREFSRLSSAEKGKVFRSTYVGGSEDDKVIYDSSTKLEFTLRDQLELWTWMIRDGDFDVFGYYEREASSCCYGCSHVTPKHKWIPLYRIICCDFEVTNPVDPGFGDLMRLIFDQASLQKIFAVYDVFTISKYEKMTILDMMTEYFGIHCRCLKTFISVLERIAQTNPLMVRKYVNRSGSDSENVLIRFVCSGFSERYFFDEFKRLHVLGADPNVQREGWNAVSRTMCYPMTLTYLLENGYRPSNQFIMDDYARECLENGELKRKWNDVFWPCLNLIPQMFDVWRLASQVHRSYAETPEQIEEERQRNQSYGDSIVKCLEIYDKYAPDFVNYTHASATGHTMLDYAELTGHKKLIEFVRAKTPVIMAS